MRPGTPRLYYYYAYFWGVLFRGKAIACMTRRNQVSSSVVMYVFNESSTEIETGKHLTEVKTNQNEKRTQTKTEYMTDEDESF
jgi:hypothetical protein